MSHLGSPLAHPWRRRGSFEAAGANGWSQLRGNGLFLVKWEYSVL
jgi:hypothetical protein